MSLLMLLEDEENEVIPTYTWATRPASAQSGVKIRITDVGPAGSEWISDGSSWLPVNGHVLLARSAVASSVTGTASETALATVTIPAALMGTNGRLRLTTVWSTTNSANGKTLRVRLGGASGTMFLVVGPTTTASAQIQTTIRNRNSASSQVGFPAGSTASFVTSASAVTTGTVNTDSAQDLVITGQLSNTGETITLEAYELELLR